MINAQCFFVFFPFRAAVGNISSLFGIVQDQIIGQTVGDVQVDDPVQKVKAGETDGEDDARVFVDVRRWRAPQLIQILAVAHQSQFFVDHGRHHVCRRRSVAALYKRKARQITSRQSFII